MRLAAKTLPGEIKRIAALPGRPLQADAGRFRILHVWQGADLYILAIFAQHQQADVFRALRRAPKM